MFISLSLSPFPPASPRPSRAAMEVPTTTTIGTGASENGSVGGFHATRRVSATSSLLNPLEHPYHNVTTPPVNASATMSVRPVKQGVQFHLNLAESDLPAEVGDVMRCIKVIAEKTLYHWKFFPIILPTSLTGLDDGTGRGIEGMAGFSDFFLFHFSLFSLLFSVALSSLAFFRPSSLSFCSSPFSVLLFSFFFLLRLHPFLLSLLMSQSLLPLFSSF